MTKEDREQLNEFNRELMVLSTDYEDLQEKLSVLGKEIFAYKVKINNELNGEAEPTKSTPP